VQGNSITRELAMAKVAGIGEKRVEALRLADAFRARVIGAGMTSFIFEITGMTTSSEAMSLMYQPCPRTPVRYVPGPNRDGRDEGLGGAFRFE
jgi:acetolactate synthase small subunit